MGTVQSYVPHEYLYFNTLGFQCLSKIKDLACFSAMLLKCSSTLKTCNLFKLVFT